MNTRTEFGFISYAYVFISYIHLVCENKKGIKEKRQQKKKKPNVQYKIEIIFSFFLG